MTSAPNEHDVASLDPADGPFSDATVLEPDDAEAVADRHIIDPSAGQDAGRSRPVRTSTMDKIRIRGGRPLSGDLPIDGQQAHAIELAHGSLRLNQIKLTVAEGEQVREARVLVGPVAVAHTVKQEGSDVVVQLQESVTLNSELGIHVDFEVA